MKCGVVAFVTDRGLGVCDLARQVEAAGLESLFLVQNTHVPVSGAALLDEEGHEADHRLLDPFAALGAAAAVTTRIKLGTGICTALIYDPVILAMQVSTLDQLSAGRFLFGIGVGHEDTVHNHGISPTAGVWEIDEPLMQNCAELGVDRCVVVYHAEDKDGLPAFLERYERLVERFGG